MNKRYCLFTIIFFSASITFSQINQDWKWSHPKPQGNALKYVKLFSPSNWILIGYPATFMSTTNAGINWIVSHKAGGFEGLTQKWLYGAYFWDMNTGIVCGSGGWVGRTTTGGILWDSIPTGTNNTFYGMSFVNSNTGFIGGGTSLMKTTNAGLNWTSIPLQPASSYIMNALYAIDVNHIYAPLSSGYQIIKTTNGGSTWDTISTGSTTVFYDILFIDVNTGFLCGNSGTFRRSTNGGINWASLGNFSWTNTLAKLYYSSPYLYLLGSRYYIYRSSDFGITWDSSYDYVSTELIGAQFNGIDIFGNNIVIGGTSGVINLSTDNGASWTTPFNIIFGGSFNDIWAETMSGNVWAVGSSVPPIPSIIYSSDGGNTWVTQSEINMGLNSICMLNSSTGFVCGGNGVIYNTTNSGNIWSQQSSPTTQMLNKIEFIDANTGWAFGSSGTVLWTTNGGSDWTSGNSNYNNSITWGSMVNAYTGWFAGALGCVSKTTDGGKSWNAQNINTNQKVNCIQMFDINTGFLCGNSGLLKHTTNGGVTWDSIATGITTTNFQNMHFFNPSSGTIIGYMTGAVLTTTNSGLNWVVSNTGGGFFNYGFYMISPDSMWLCGTGSAIMKYVKSPLGVNSITYNIPKNYILHQNYPNPFNPETKIVFELPLGGIAELIIYDILGREVKRLLNNEYKSAGKYVITFDGEDLPSGVYFCRFRVNDFTCTKKIVLMK